MRRLITVAGKPAIFIFKLDNLYRTAALFVAVPICIFTPSSGMCEIEQKCPFTANHDIGVMAFDLVFGSGAGISK